jgi:IS4 transposase
MAGSISRSNCIVRPPQAAEAARRWARRATQKSGYTINADALLAAEWVVLVTSLARETFAAGDVLALYRLRWRVELAFKRLKSLIGLKALPGRDASTARAFILAHLLMILLLEPLTKAFEDSPHWDQAA